MANKATIKEHHGNKNVWLLGGSSLFNDVGSEMITPLLPFYVATLGGNGAALGLLSGLREGLASLLKLIGGWLSDFTGKRRPFVFFGYAFSSIFRALLVLANSWRSILVFVSLERIGKLRDAPRDAIIAHSVKKRGRAFALHQSLDTTGGIIGTLIVIFLFWFFGFGMRTIIIVASLVSLFSLVPLFFVKDPKTPKFREHLWKGIKQLDGRLKYFIFASVVFTLANFGLYFFLILRAQQITGSVVLSLALYAVFNLSYAVFAVPFGKLSDKVGRKHVLFLGYVLFLVAIAGFMIAFDFEYLTLIFVVYGLVYAIVQSNQKAYAADLAGKMKGTALGLYSAAVGIITIPAGLIAGVLWDVNPLTMFYYIFAVGLVSLVLLYFVKEGNEFRK